MPQTASSQDEAVRQAAIAIETDRPAEAEKIARDVLSHNAGNVRAMHLLGAALLMQQRASEALEPLERAAKQKRDPAVETHLAIALRQIGR
ncbi:MAG: tetratricopeptide repeat protein, partial [Pseudolabrys sp.]|nr:tetratricopeptide repeat protein [Pseudolabrys sp.]